LTATRIAMPKLDDLKRLLDEARTRAVPARPHDVGAKPRNGAAHPRPVAAEEPPGAAKPVPVSVKRTIGAGKHSDRDIDLAVAFADVRKLPPSTRVQHTRRHPSPIPHQRIADERDALLASKYGVEPAPHSWDIGQELEGEQTFLRRGLRSDVLSKLRRGHWSVQGELDLHGLTTQPARDLLADFIADARQRGYRCVRVIHGKGLTSPNREPVLKGKVRKWLAQWDDVLAYTEAPQHAGGGGAVLILLRGSS
jgi:DNA-nicking Smr family endonuclease